MFQRNPTSRKQLESKCIWHLREAASCLQPVIAGTVRRNEIVISGMFIFHGDVEQTKDGINLTTCHVHVPPNKMMAASELLGLEILQVRKEKKQRIHATQGSLHSCAGECPHVFHTQDILSFKMKSFTQQQCNHCDALFNATVTALTCNWVYFKGPRHQRKTYDWTVLNQYDSGWCMNVWTCGHDLLWEK